MVVYTRRQRATQMANLTRFGRVVILINAAMKMGVRCANLRDMILPHLMIAIQIPSAQDMLSGVVWNAQLSLAMLNYMMERKQIQHVLLFQKRKMESAKA